MSTGKYSPIIGITNIFWLAFMMSHVCYVIIAYTITKSRGDDMFVITIPDHVQIIFLLLVIVSVVEIIAGFFIRAKLPVSFLKSSQNSFTPGQGSKKIQQMDPDIRETAAKAQTLSIILFAFFEAVGVFGLLSVFLGCSLMTMFPFVVISMFCLFIVRPTENFFDRVGERLREMNQ